MKPYPILPLAFVLLGTPALACICESSPVFDFRAYDLATYVVEVEVLEKLSEPQPLDTLLAPGPRLPEPPPRPRISPDYYEDFQVRILVDFKGSAKSIYQLRTLGRKTSCYWAPEPGDRFVLYSDGLRTPEAKQMFVIRDACQRKLMANTAAYEEEKQILQQIQNADDGRLTIADPRSDDRPLAKMKFAAGQPVGTWRLYDPFDPQNPKPLVKVIFRNGRMHRMRWSRHQLSAPAQRYRSRWKFELGQ